MINSNLKASDVGRAFCALDEWISENGLAGYDPYDIRGQEWYVRLFGAQNWFFRKVRGAFAVLEQELPPAALRRTLRVRKEINPKGMGLIAQAYLTRWEVTDDHSWRTKAEGVLAWLADNPCRDSPGMSWGYPFHWQSRIFLPRGTPAVVVTGAIGDAWLQHYELTRASQSLDVAEKIAEFFIHGLNRPVDDGHRLCFSYTPLDDFKVHNASLFAAAFLARLGELTGNQEYSALALRAVRYTLSEQNADGSFYYWGSEPPTIIDHYHTGFVLRHLDTVRRSTSANFITDPLSRGYEFYLRQLFNADGIPNFTPDSLYPIDIHSCTEALLCVCQLGPEFGGSSMLEPVFRLTQEKMRNADGWYIAGIRERRGKEAPINIPYLRWGQAWMLLALARLEAVLRDSPIASGDSL